MTSKTLDADFADLQRWTSQWAVDTEAERLAARASADYAQLCEFYDAMAPRMEAIIDHLNAAPVQRLTANQQTLFQLAQSYFEAALSVELLHEPDEAVMLPPERLRIDIEGGLS